MAGRFESVTFLAAIGFLAGISLAQAADPTGGASPSPSIAAKVSENDASRDMKPEMPPPPDADLPSDRHPHDGDPKKMGPPPDRRGGNFEQNKKLWDTLTPEQKALIRASFEERQKRIKDEIDDAIKQTGLKLDDKQRNAFSKRYFEERRKIERKLHQEMDLQRKTMTTTLIGQLKDEFSKSSPTPSPSPAPKASPAPSSTSTPSK
jgi:hypothetical protein